MKIYKMLNKNALFWGVKLHKKSHILRSITAIALDKCDRLRTLQREEGSPTTSGLDAENKN